MTVSTIPPAIAEESVRALVDDWFRKFNMRAPVEEILRFFVQNGLVIRLPEPILRSHDDVRGWWEAMLRRPPEHIDVPQELDILITSPMHADVTMKVTRQTTGSTPARVLWTAGASWSLVADGSIPKIRTYTVYPPRLDGTEISRRQSVRIGPAGP
jgi:hypothetical protein